MYSIVRATWFSLHEPRVVTLATMFCYGVLSVFGMYCLLNPHWGPFPFWHISAVLLATLGPVAFVTSWRGMWQIERPVMIGVVGGLLINLVISFADTQVGDFRIGYLVTFALVVQAFVARWVRIRTSYVSPARMVSEYESKLPD